ncbi:MAG: integration host factor subunit beta [Phycisphaeraceae bacterium]|nr:integration host factor subunit beta [Phycisphaeraceae bacterium]QYK48197.1 MAG: integration host factor subunit beta [Phycisphaeraceae bacterium]
MATITKKDLIDRISEKSGVRRSTVKDVVQMFLDQITDELAAGNRLEFRDFGVFEVKSRAARTAQNPKTLQRVSVPPKRSVKFKGGRLMRDRLEGEPPMVEVTAAGKSMSSKGAKAASV